MTIGLSAAYATANIRKIAVPIALYIRGPDDVILSSVWAVLDKRIYIRECLTIVPFLICLIRDKININSKADIVAVIMSIASPIRFSLVNLIFNTLKNSSLITAMIPTIISKFKSANRLSKDVRRISLHPFDNLSDNAFCEASEASARGAFFIFQHDFLSSETGGLEIGRASCRERV